MSYRFFIHYITRWGENLQVVMHDASSTVVPMHHVGGGRWESVVCEPEALAASYHYRVILSGSVEREEARGHMMPLAEAHCVHVVDRWLDKPDEGITVSMRQWLSYMRPKLQAGNVIFNAVTPPLRPGLSLALCGSLPPLGSWNPSRALIMQRLGSTLWTLNLPLKSGTSLSFEYKFVVIDNHGGEPVGWENSSNRCITVTSTGDSDLSVVGCEVTALPLTATCPASDVVIPLYALRSADDYGCGDIGDLRKLMNWARRVHRPMLEVRGLAHHRGYERAIDPCYLALSLMPQPDSALERRRFKASLMELDGSSTVDFDEVRRLKLEWARLSMLTVEGKRLIHSRMFRRFVAQEASWLQGYTTMLSLRSRTLAAYIQFVLRRQLQTMVDYAVEHDLLLMVGSAPLVPEQPRRMARSLEEHLASRLPHIEL